MKASVQFKKGWVDSVEHGTPFELTEDEPEETQREITRPRRKGPIKKGTQKVRRLHDMGELMTVEEVAKFMKVNVDYIYWLIKEQKLPKVLIGARKFRIAVRDLEEYLSA